MFEGVLASGTRVAVKRLDLHLEQLEQLEAEATSQQHAAECSAGGASIRDQMHTEVALLSESALLAADMLY